MSGEMLWPKEEGEMLLLKSRSLRNPYRGGNPISQEALASPSSSPCFRCAGRCEESDRALPWQKLRCLWENNKEKESYLSMSMARGGLCDVCFSLMLLRFLISFPEPEGSDAGDFWQFLSRLLYSAGFRLAFPLPAPLRPFWNELQLILDVVEPGNTSFLPPAH